MNSVSFVVPVYNGAKVLERFYDRMLPICKKFRSYEIIFVDDGSTDNSRASLDLLCRKNRNVCLVQLTRNFGQHNATLAGMAHARHEIVVTLDQDLQNPPEEIPRLLEKLNEGYDVVYGLPEARAHGWFRNLTSELSKSISKKILSTALKGNFGSFRALRKWVVDEILKYNSPYIFIDGLISWATSNVGGVTVRNEKSEFESHYTFMKLINHGFNLLVNFSIRPLQIASLVGVLCALLGLLAAALVIIDKLLFGVPVQGWASIMVVVLVMGGAQLIFLGLMGEYVGRVLMNSNSAPKYVIREVSRGKVSVLKKST